MSERSAGGSDEVLPPIEWPEDAPSTDERGSGDRPAPETAPRWAAALRFQLLGVLVVLSAGLIAVGTLGIVSMVAETVAIGGVVVGLYGFFAWPDSASNNS